MADDPEGQTRNPIALGAIGLDAAVGASPTEVLLPAGDRRLLGVRPASIDSAACFGGYEGMRNRGAAGATRIGAGVPMEF
jgi:hypothetical protein